MLVTVKTVYVKSIVIVVHKKTTNENIKGNKNHSFTQEAHASVLKLKENVADNKNKKAITIILHKNPETKTHIEFITNLIIDIFLGLCKCSVSNDSNIMNY